MLADGGSASLGLWFDSLDDQELSGILAGWADRDTDASLLPSFADEREAFLDAWTRLTPPVTREECLRCLARLRLLDDGRWTPWNPPVLRWLEQDSWTGAWSGMRDADSSPPFLRDSALQRPLEVFAELAVPVLVIDPTGDAMDLSEQNRELALAHPAFVHVVEYEDTGHDVIAERPAQFVSDVLHLAHRVCSAAHVRSAGPGS